MNDSAVAIIEQPASQSESVLAVISRASTDPNVDIDKMERLLEMLTTMRAKDAEMAYRADMSKLQAAMPTIKERGKIMVKGELRSTYAKFEDILEATKPILKKYGFSVAFRSEYPGDKICIIGTISHKGGHSESTPIELPLDVSPGKNTVQMVGSSTSYGMRYAYRMLLNIASTGDDDDGNSADPSSAPDKMLARLIDHNNVLRMNLSSVLAVKEGIASGELSSAKECWAELSEREHRALWVATSKGGIFSTVERDTIHSNEWNKTK